MFNQDIPEFKCDDCNMVQYFLKQEYDLKDNKYVVICISLVWNEKESDSKISNFNPDAIIIPGDDTNHKYILKSAIIYKSSLKNLNNENEKGHYTCFTKFEEGWLNISDASATYHQNFIVDLKDVYLVFLEKTKTSIKITFN